MRVALVCRALHHLRPASHTSENGILIRVEPSGPVAPRTVPLAVAIVLDTSGSMEGPRIEAALAAVGAALDALPPTDYATVIGFDDKARVLWPLQPVGNSSSLRPALRRVRAGGGTHLAAGVELAVERLRAPHLRQSLRRLVIISDGAPSHPPRTLDAFAGCVSRLLEEGIAVSTIGLGGEFDEELLAGLATGTGGRYVPLDTAGSLTDVLIATLRAFDRAALAQLSLRIEPLELTRLTDAGTPLSVTLPDLAEDQAYEAFLPLAHDPRPPGDYTVLRTSASALDPASGKVISAEGSVRVRFVPDPSSEPASAPEVAAAAAVRGGEAALAKAMAELRSGRSPVSTVVSRLEAAAAAFQSGGREDLAYRVHCVVQGLHERTLADPNKWLAAAVQEVRIRPAPQAPLGAAVRYWGDVEPMSVTEGRTYYEILGVAPDASLEEITDAYRALVRRYADDKPRFDLITEAYMALADPDARHEYDQSLRHGAGQGAGPPAGHPLDAEEQVCPACGSRNAASSHFCGVCGKVLRPPGGGTRARPKLGIGIIHLPDGHSLSIEDGEVVIGRSPQCTVTISDDPYVSAQHARIQCLMGIFTIQDLGSTNGSFLNGKRLTEGKSVKLQDGDVIVLGTTELRFEIR